MADSAISVLDLGKRYRIGRREERPDTLASAAWSLLSRPAANLARLRDLRRISPDEQRDDLIWALADVSFAVEEGEVLGIIGRNGAGKSTLLKILSRITEPTCGRAEIRGRVASLLEVGTGFHPELTGRENIYLNGTILGMRKREIDGSFDEIVEFAGIGRFLDTPIKRYSSGMKVRLAFAVAAHLQAEVLLIDEVLAVGDIGFQRKCLGKMHEVSRSGRTVLFVSHSMATISGLCERCIFLDGGRIVADGETRQVVQRYLAAVDEHTEQVDLEDREDREGSGRARITSFDLVSPETGDPVGTALAGERAVFRIGYRVADGASPLSPVQASIQVFTLEGGFLTALTNYVTGDELAPLSGRGYVYCSVPRFPLMEGRYRVSLLLISAEGVVDRLDDAATIEVEAGDFYGTGLQNSFSRQGLFVDQTWSETPPRVSATDAEAP